MTRSLQQLWWKSLERLSKRQRASSAKLVKSLLPKPARKTRSKVAKARPLTLPVRREKTIVSAHKAGIETRLPRDTRAASSTATGKWLTGYFSSYELDRTLPVQRLQYWLYLPSTVAAAAPPAKPLPLVVMLHGCEQSATEFAQGTRMNLLAEQKGFAVLYPQQTRKAHPNRCWHWYAPATQQGGGETLLIAATIQKMLHKHGLDQSRVYVAGLSAGAAMAASVALNYPQLVAAVGLHSAPVFGIADSMMDAYAVMQRGDISQLKQPIQSLLKRSDAFPPLPAILIQGMHDSVVRPINQVQLTQQLRLLRKLSAPVPTFQQAPLRHVGSGSGEYEVHDYLDHDKVFLRICEVTQLDHAWSGGDTALRFNGPGPDASKLMWDFFKTQRRRPVQPSPSDSE